MINTFYLITFHGLYPYFLPHYVYFSIWIKSILSSNLNIFNYTETSFSVQTWFYPRLVV